MTCIPVGVQRDLGLRPEEEVTFTQTSAEPYHYRDAIQFGGGQIIYLQSLRQGICFKVLALVPAHESTQALQLRNPVF